MTLAIATFLDQLEIGSPTCFERLTLWPLHPKAAPAAGLRYRPLAEALDRGDVVVEEISERGSVPNVLVRNLCDEALLVLFGEELRGAKQNRIANASFLIPPRAQIVIDVSCVEAGRWHTRSRPTPGEASPRFDESGPVVSHTIRSRMHRAVADSRASGRRFAADQAAVWEDVSASLRESRTASSSSAYSDYFAARAERMAEAGKHFEASGVGFVAAIDGEIAGVEVIGDAAVFAQSFSRLLASYLVDAVREGETAGATGVADPGGFLAAVREAPVTGSPSLGLGEDLRLRSDGVEGAALVAGEVVHLTASPRVRRNERPRRWDSSPKADFGEGLELERLRHRRGAA